MEEGWEASVKLTPSKAEKLKSQRNLQKIRRTEESTKAIKNHEELMETHSNDMSRVCRKLKQIRGDKSKSNDISIIETLCGTYEGQNVLEGFVQILKSCVMRITKRPS